MKTILYFSIPILTLLSFFSYIFEVNIIFPFLFIGITDFILFSLLLISALLSDGNGKGWMQFPNRLESTLLFFFAFATLCLSFSEIFLSDNCHFNKDNIQISDPFDALYFSIGTLTTITFGDFVPNDAYTRKIALLEIASSVLLFLGIFSLLISRFTFPDKDAPEGGV